MRTEALTGAAEGALGALIPSIGLTAKAETLGAGVGKITLGASLDATNFLKGAAAVAADAVVDTGLQKLTHYNVNGHEMFKPTGVEMFGIGIATAAPLDIRMKAAVIGLSWLAGRVQNRFE